MKIRPLLIILISISLLQIIPGCLNRPTSYHVSESIKIQISASIQDAYVLIPLMVVKIESDIPTDLSNSVHEYEPNCSIRIESTDKGNMFNVSFNNTRCSFKGSFKEDGISLGRSEQYLDYTWSTNNSEIRPKALEIFHSRSTGIGQTRIDMSYKGLSNYCSRSASFEGYFLPDGSWQTIKGDDSAVCT